jgi:hypothetical protein
VPVFACMHQHKTGSQASLFVLVMTLLKDAQTAELGEQLNRNPQAVVRKNSIARIRLDGAAHWRGKRGLNPRHRSLRPFGLTTSGILRTQAGRAVVTVRIRREDLMVSRDLTKGHFGW